MQERGNLFYRGTRKIECRHSFSRSPTLDDRNDEIAVFVV
jgi:hypothetical protein